jgi:dTDP-4-dehydrorhamnose 3,5-epimerase
MQKKTVTQILESTLMIFKKTKIANLYIGTLQGFKDDRGIFTRIYCHKIFKKKFNYNFKQANICVNPKKGTFRGLHYQIGKYSEEKVVQLIKGKTQHIIIDKDKKSKTYKKIFTYFLTENKREFLVIPKSCAHGYLTLKKNTSIIYFTTNFFNKDKSRGINIKDSIFQKIKLPTKILKISDQDKKWLHKKY